MTWVWQVLLLFKTDSEAFTWHSCCGWQAMHRWKGARVWISLLSSFYYLDTISVDVTTLQVILTFLLVNVLSFSLIALAEFPIHTLYLGGPPPGKLWPTQEVKISSTHRSSTLQPHPPCHTHRHQAACISSGISISHTYIYLRRSTTISTLAATYWFSVYGAAHSALSHSRQATCQWIAWCYILPYSGWRCGF